LWQGIFDWDEPTQSLILGAFYYGLATTQIISGRISEKIGGKIVMLLGLLWTSLLTILTPVSTTIGGFGALFVIRLLEGMGAVCNESSR